MPSPPFLRKLNALDYPHIDSITKLLTPRPASGATAVSSSLSVFLPSVSLRSTASLRALIVWLEFTKIRFYPVEQRESLKDISGSSWGESLHRYLADLECPFVTTPTQPPDDYSGEQLAILLDWLLTQAVSAEFNDQASEYNSLGKMMVMTQGAEEDAMLERRRGPGATSVAPPRTSHSGTAAPTVSTLPSSWPLLGCSNREEIESAISSLCSLFRLPFLPDQLGSILRTIRKRVEEGSIGKVAQEKAKEIEAQRASKLAPGRFAKGAQKAASAAAAASGSSSSASSTIAQRSAPQISSPDLPKTAEEVFALLDQMDLGFPSTGDALVDHAAQVFRLLFLHDLRATQNLANEILSLAQQYTSDPKTDAKLGHVGR